MPGVPRYNRPFLSRTVSEHDLMNTLAVTPAESLPDAQAAPLWQRAWRWIGRLLVAAALAGLLWALGRALVLFAEHGRAAVAFPFTLNYGEGPLLEQAARLAHGENIYRADLTTPPYTITNYPPLYVLAQAPLVRAYGPEFWYGRLISLISTAVAALFLGLTARALTRSWIAGLVAGGLLLAVPYLLHWSALARIDSLALALSWAGLWLAVQYPPDLPAGRAAGCCDLAVARGRLPAGADLRRVAGGAGAGDFRAAGGHNRRRRVLPHHYR
jgi:hypothetical protein